MCVCDSIEQKAKIIMSLHVSLSETERWRKDEEKEKMEEEWGGV